MTQKRKTRTAKEDLQWIEALRAGDPVAFRQMIERYQGIVYQVCLRMMDYNVTEAEDMAQETFIRVAKALDQFRGDSKLSTWVYRIAVNICKNRISYLKRRAQYRHDHLTQLEEDRGDAWQKSARPTESLSTPDELAEAHEAQVLINRALTSLPPHMREVITLRDLEGLSYAEIVEVLEIPLGTVKSRLHQARLLLMQSYQALQDGQPEGPRSGESHE